MKGCTDVLNQWEVRGWAYDPKKRAKVVIEVNRREAAVVTAEYFRPDLRAAGFGDGCAGFQIGLAQFLQAGTHSVRVLFADNRKPLPNGEGTVTAQYSAAELLAEMQSREPYPALSYAIVRDYCDSADWFPDLARRVGDMKDAQRPWMLKALLNRLKPSAKVLEIGGGEPLAAAYLSNLGYAVTICDPFDGCGNGPTEFDAVKAQYPRIEFNRSYFTPEIARNMPAAFDAVFSISVAEHIPCANLKPLFQAINAALKPGGFSIHAMDVVLEGHEDKKHWDQLALLLALQNELSGAPLDLPRAEKETHELLARARADLETYYLSASGHNIWRGTLSYAQFPFRKCISAQTICQLNTFRSRRI